MRKLLIVGLFLATSFLLLSGCSNDNSSDLDLDPDVTIPVITLLGTTPVDIQMGAAYVDEGATAVDNNDGVITGSIVTVNPVDVNTAGTYTVTYNVNDAAGNSAIQVTRIVNVTNPDKYLGGLVWDNYTKNGAGGSGTFPVGVDSTTKDFLRCKACHGWDGKGDQGGYVRRTVSATRPNPTANIGDISAKAEAGTVMLDEVWHNGNANSSIIGRAFSTLDNTMPDYSQAGGLTAIQANNVVDFLNNGEKLTSFADLDIMPNPVGYSFNGATDAAAGAILYADNCAGCHGVDGLNDAISGVKLDAYFSSDGKYSEGFHKILYGIAGTAMTRTATGNLTGQQAADILAYIQDAIAPNYYKGGLVWDNYTKTDAGGAGNAPTNKDFVRCKACHGWDGRGLEGGYVRRTANATRPNPTATIGNLSSVMGSVVVADVAHSGGRAITDESQAMPDYTTAGGLTAKQVADVVAYLNSAPKITDHATLDITTNPVTYTFSGTDAAAGATRYTANCAGCHGADGMNIAIGTGGLGDYFSSDGKYSEGFHKIIYGIANTPMSRKAVGNLTSQEAADILTYIQAELAAGTTL